VRDLNKILNSNDQFEERLPALCAIQGSIAIPRYRLSRTRRNPPLPCAGDSQIFLKIGLEPRFVGEISPELTASDFKKKLHFLPESRAGGAAGWWPPTFFRSNNCLSLFHRLRAVVLALFIYFGRARRCSRAETMRSASPIGVCDWVCSCEQMVGHSDFFPRWCDHDRRALPARRLRRDRLIFNSTSLGVSVPGGRRACPPRSLVRSGPGPDRG